MKSNPPEVTIKITEQLKNTSINNQSIISSNPIDDNRKVELVELLDTLPPPKKISFVGRRATFCSNSSSKRSSISGNSFLPKHSNYRHVAIDSATKYTQLFSQNVDILPESDGFDANCDYFAFFIEGAGGRIGVWPVKKQGRFPTKIPCIINGSDVNDFKFDPFRNKYIITACEDGRLRLFKVMLSSVLIF